MDALILFGLSPDAEAMAADPWKWAAFRNLAAPLLKHWTLWYTVLIFGLLAGTRLRRQSPVVARQVWIGCVGLLAVGVARALCGWAWTIIDPDPVAPWTNATRWVIAGVGGLSLAIAAVFYLGQLAFIWVLASAAIHGRDGETKESAP